MALHKDHEEMCCRNFKIPSLGRLNETENAVFSCSAYVDQHTCGHLDRQNCQDGATAMFVLADQGSKMTTKKRDIVPFTVFGSYTLLQHDKKKGLGIELRCGDLNFAHTRKELHGSAYLKEPKRSLLVFQQHSKVQYAHHKRYMFSDLHRPTVNFSDSKAIEHHIDESERYFP